MGFTEILLLAGIALIVVGPRQIPELARTLARFINELKRTTGDIGATLADTKKQAHKVWEETQRAVDPTELLLPPEGTQGKNNAQADKEPPANELSDPPTSVQSGLDAVVDSGTSPASAANESAAARPDENTKVSSEDDSEPAKS